MTTRTPSSDVAFTPAVKAVQERRGSRKAYRRMEERGGWQTRVTPDLAALLPSATAPILQPRTRPDNRTLSIAADPKAFIRVIDEKTLGLADYAGNRQYISTGNLTENDRAFLFLMNYAKRRRVKIWGRARVVADDPQLLARLMP